MTISFDAGAASASDFSSDFSSGSSWFMPDWPAPAGVRSLTTTRVGGISRGVYAGFNLGDHVDDEPAAVAANRARLAEWLGGEPVWLRQVHGTHVVDAAQWQERAAPEADAAFARQPGVICAVMTADCLPVLLCDDAGSVVAAAHAGWRGLLDGVLEATVKATGVPGEKLMAWLGPAIGPLAFEVGQEVRDAFVAASASADAAFRPAAGAGKYLADIYCLARQRLAGQGVSRVFGGSLCTVSDAERFFSYRRDGQTGRMATMIWLE